MFVGFGSLILRTIYGVVFGLVNIQRMDIPTLAYVYEGFDAGYGAYVGFHIVRKTHTHPIILSFISLLLEMKNGKEKDTATTMATSGSLMIALWMMCRSLLKTKETTCNIDQNKK